MRWVDQISRYRRLVLSALGLSETDHGEVELRCEGWPLPARENAPHTCKKEPATLRQVPDLEYFRPGLPARFNPLKEPGMKPPSDGLWNPRTEAI